MTPIRQISASLHQQQTFTIMIAAPQAWHLQGKKQKKKVKKKKNYIN